MDCACTSPTSTYLLTYVQSLRVARFWASRGRSWQEEVQFPPSGNWSLQEKYDLAIAKFCRGSCWNRRLRRNRKKKTVVGGSLPQYVYCTEGERTIVRVIVPGRRAKIFGLNRSPGRNSHRRGNRVSRQASRWRGRGKPKVAKDASGLHPLVRSQKQASRHPRPSAGMMKQYSFRTARAPKKASCGRDRAQDDIAAGRAPERPKASKKTLPTHITWRDDLRRNLRDPHPKTYNFGFRGSTEPKEDLIESSRQEARSNGHISAACAKFS